MMKPTTRAWILAISCAATGACAAAENQAIYRCGNTYSQTPCSTGRLVDAEDSRTAAQHDDAISAFSREQRLADRMERDRLQREARLRPALASGFDIRSSPLVQKIVVAHAAGKSKRRPASLAAAAETETFVAFVPAPRRAAAAKLADAANR